MNNYKPNLHIALSDPKKESLPIVATNNSYTALVLNSNREMANEITSQLAEQVNECAIVYAPTLELAKIILKKQSVNLIISTPILPDGHIRQLEPVLRKIPNPPDIVVFADSNQYGVSLFESSQFHFISIRQIESTKTQQSVSQVSSDIRDALNNPLQEIVSLVFIAHSAQCSETTNRVLDAIELAAQKMAGIVWGIEDMLYENIIAQRASRGNLKLR